MAGSAALELKSVGKKFGDTDVLSDIDLSVESGEIICLVGRSGCGKSTLLRIIAGVETPDKGSVSLNGAVVAGSGAFIEPEKRNIGFVFQDYALFPHLTVEQNVMFGLRSLPKAQARARTAEMIEHVHLKELAKRYPHTLSGGEQQRVALARALAPQPGLLLMDEPFSNLDRGLRDDVREETLGLLRQLGTTAIMVTHDPEEALSAGDRVVLMQRGRIVQSGTGYEIHDNPKTRYAADFFCAFNKIEGRVRQGRVETPLACWGMPPICPMASRRLPMFGPMRFRLSKTPRKKVSLAKYRAGSSWGRSNSSASPCPDYQLIFASEQCSVQPPRRGRYASELIRRAC